MLNVLNNIEVLKELLQLNMNAFIFSHSFILAHMVSMYWHEHMHWNVKLYSSNFLS